METTFPQFDKYVCVGDTITWNKDGFDITARIAQDYDTKPTDFECYTPEDVQRWKNDEWFYCGVVLAVTLQGIDLDHHAASLWGIDCNFGDDNAYLSEIAQELEHEALQAARTEVARIREVLGQVPA
jgi:hypothetical protein